MWSADDRAGDAARRQGHGLGAAQVASMTTIRARHVVEVEQLSAIGMRWTQSGCLGRART
jgi:hypothetical protein